MVTEEDLGHVLKELRQRGKPGWTCPLPSLDALPQLIWHQVGAGSRENRNTHFRKIPSCGSLIWNSISLSLKEKGNSWGLKECLSMVPSGVKRGEIWNSSRARREGQALRCGGVGVLCKVQHQWASTISSLSLWGAPQRFHLLNNGVKGRFWWNYGCEIAHAPAWEKRGIKTAKKTRKRIRISQLFMNTDAL